jgi:hypothetical protein
VKHKNNQKSMAKAHLGSISFVNQIANLADQLVEAGLGAGKLGGPGQRRVTWLAAAEKTGYNTSR